MKLYFYRVNTNERYGKLGITVQVREAVEKTKTYWSVGDAFPGTTSRVRKDSIGEIDDRWLVLTEPNFEYAKKKFTELLKSKVAVLKESIEREERELKLIEESEE